MFLGGVTPSREAVEARGASSCCLDSGLGWAEESV